MALILVFCVGHPHSNIQYEYGDDFGLVSSHIEDEYVDNLGKK